MPRTLSLIVVALLLAPGCADSPQPLGQAAAQDGGPEVDSSPGSGGSPWPDMSPIPDTGGADAGGGAGAGASGLTIIPGCSALTKESAYCIATVGSPTRLVMFGLDTGTVCSGAKVQTSLSGASSLGWLGDSIYVCQNGTAARIKVATGAVTSRSTPCVALTEQGGGLLVMHAVSSPDLTWYPTFNDLAAKTKGKSHSIKHYASRLAAHKSDLYFAWHSTGEVQVSSLTAGTTTTLKLKGYDGWIWGMDATDTGSLVIGNADKVYLFDLKTGALKKQLTLKGSASINQMWGLSCASGAPDPVVP